MGKRIQNSEEMIAQKSVGFFTWQKRFINEHPEFKVDPYCRQILNEQIKILVDVGRADKKWLEFIK